MDFDKPKSTVIPPSLMVLFAIKIQTFCKKVTKFYETLKIIFRRPFPTFNSMPSFQDLIGIALLALARAIISISIEMPSGAG